jgi:glyoxylase-like metal-dependent hydrolase (beta-lactamase superfamily II)
MSTFKKVSNYIYRLEVPFFTVYTSVFLIDTPEGYILVDCATTDEDVDGYIIPALEKQGVELANVKKIVITHDHSDHAGGLSQILRRMPHIEVIRTVEELSDKICTYPLPGHTRDFIGVFDERTGTLISGDGLQGAGIKQYRTMLDDKRGYIETLEGIKRDERIEHILFSHAYEPWYKDFMFGREEVLGCIEECKKYIGEIK